MNVFYLPNLQFSIPVVYVSTSGNKIGMVRYLSEDRLYRFLHKLQMDDNPESIEDFRAKLVLKDIRKFKRLLDRRISSELIYCEHPSDVVLFLTHSLTYVELCSMAHPICYELFIEMKLGKRIKA